MPPLTPREVVAASQRRVILRRELDRLDSQIRSLEIQSDTQGAAELREHRDELLDEYDKLGDAIDEVNPVARLSGLPRWVR